MDRPDRQSRVEALLHRPAEQRLREYTYRCAQSIVFGLPVVGLHYFGHRLGGPEAEAVGAAMQALLGGWVMYVGAAGMLFEGVVRRRPTGDLLVSLGAIGIYLISLISLLLWPILGRPPVRLMFHASVAVVAVWTGIQWARGSAKTRA